jgi:hypothetical protein
VFAAHHCRLYCLRGVLYGFVSLHRLFYTRPLCADVAILVLITYYFGFENDATSRRR